MPKNELDLSFEKMYFINTCNVFLFILIGKKITFCNLLFKVFFFIW